MYKILSIAQAKKTARRLHKQGKTIIIVTHDEDLASKAKKQIVLKDGLIENKS